MRFRLLILFTLFGWAAMAQKPTTDTIPVSVQEAFSKEYPDSKIKFWEHIGSNYIATTKIDGQAAKTTISAQGEWVETTFETSENELPGRITNYINNNFSGYEPKLTQYTESKNNGAFYYVTINKKGTGETAAELFFDASGSFLKKNEFHPINATLSSSAQQEAVRKEKEDREKKEYDERRAKLLAMDRTISESAMPGKVKDNFRKKFPKGVIAKWDSLDNTYTAHFTQDEMPIKADFGLNADWQATYEDVSTGEISRPVDQYIETNYPALKVKFAERVTRRDKNNYFYVELNGKAKKGETPPVTKLTFDKSGNLTKTEEPKVTEEVAEEEPAKKEEGPDRFEQKVSKEDAVPAEVDADAPIDPSELPSPITSFVSNYKGYKVSKAYFGDHEEGANTYKVEIKKEGVGQKGYPLYFDDQGKYISGELPKMDKKNTAKADEPVEREEKVSVGTSTPSRAPAPKKAKGKNAYQDPGAIDEVPDNVKKNFTRKFPKAVDPFWSVDEQTFTVEFSMNEMKNTVLFSADGQAQVTRTEMDPGMLMNPINRYIDDKFKGYKVRYAEKVTRKDRKNHFYVEIYSKKRGASPPETQLYFDTSGRLMQNPPE